MSESRHEPIAIVGIGCRFPGGADSPAAFWDLLKDGTDAIVEVPKERWNVDEFYDPHPETPGKMYKYVVEGSADEKSWKMLSNQQKSTDTEQTQRQVGSKSRGNVLVRKGHGEIGPGQLGL